MNRQKLCSVRGRGANYRNVDGLLFNVVSRHVNLQFRFSTISCLILNFRFSGAQVVQVEHANSSLSITLQNLPNVAIAYARKSAARIVRGQTRFETLILLKITG